MIFNVPDDWTEPSLHYVTIDTPSFSGGNGQPAIATLAMNHYFAIADVVCAARTGNERLIRLALKALDETSTSCLGDRTDEKSAKDSV